MKNNDCFENFKFTSAQVKGYLNNALKDLKIARHSDIAEVRFMYSYNALLKGAIALLAGKGVKVRSVPGHHIKTLEAIGQILNDKDIFPVANSMRMKRNTDLYAGGVIVSEKESKDYLGFVEKIIDRVKSKIG